MQSRWSIATFCLVACIGFVGSVLAQDAVPAPSGNSGCGQQGGYAVEGCLKGWEIRQADAEGLWNGYCEGDCRVGHSKDRDNCGRRGCGQCGGQGCGSCGQGNAFSDCGNGFGGGLRTASLRDGFGGRFAAPHPADCGCDSCHADNRTRFGFGNGLGLNGGLLNRGCGCATEAQTSAASDYSNCDQGPAMPAAQSCNSCFSGGRSGLNWGLNRNQCQSSVSNCSTCEHRPGLLSGFGGCSGFGQGRGCNSQDCGTGNSSCGAQCFGWPAACSNDCCAGSGRIHGFGLACKNRSGGGNWDNMCGRNYFGSSNGDCGCSK